MVVFSKKFFLSLLLFLGSYFPTYAQDLPELTYQIRYVAEKKQPALEVTLEFQGNAEGVTEIELPSSWAGQEELYQEISELSCLSAESHIENTELPEKKIIHHLPGEKLKLRYFVSSIEQPDIEWYYRPLICETYFFCFGYSLFVHPISDDQKVHVILEWQDFPQDWSLSNSFGVEQKYQDLYVQFSSLLHAVYTSGDFKILSCGDPQTPIYISIRGKWSFSEQRLIDLVEKIIRAQRKFWNDYDFPYYLITVIPTGSDHHMGGTGLTNAFSLFMGDFPEEDGDGWKWLSWLLSHEHFHTWNGIKIRSDSPEGSMYWFSEGFTDYYAIELNYRSGLIGFKDYLDYINNVLYDYYTSPMRNEKNERIQQDFWNDFDVQKLPYLRGFLFALYWDKKIQNRSNGSLSLDGFMHGLFKITREENRAFKKEELEELACLCGINDVTDDIECYIDRGDTIIPSENAFNSAFLVEMQDVGFNLQIALLKGRIEGVRNTSIAYASGLRNGQKFLSHKYIGSRITVVVEDKEKTPKEVSFEVNFDTNLIHQYQAK